MATDKRLRIQVQRGGNRKSDAFSAAVSFDDELGGLIEHQQVLSDLVQPVPGGTLLTSHRNERPWTEVGFRTPVFYVFSEIREQDGFLVAKLSLFLASEIDFTLQWHLLKRPRVT